MSLMRQIGLLMVAVLLLALVGAVGVNVRAARDTLEAQLRVKNSDNAQILALALSQQRDDARLMELLLSAQFDTGFYQRVRLVSADGDTVFDRHAEVQPQHAPAWFIAWLPIESIPGVAQVSDGWRALGRVEVVSQAAYTQDELWRGGSRSAMLLLFLGVLAIAVAAAGVHRIRKPLDATVAQANALVEGRYLTVKEPRAPELRRVARAMNGMVERVRRLFESQAAQVEQLRRVAHEDGVTALPHRAHFMQRLTTMLGDDGGASTGSLYLIRVADLAGLNRELGRGTADGVLRCVADVLRNWPGEGLLAGRLNGADFALALAGEGSTHQSASALADALRSALTSFGDQVVAHVGAAQWARSSEREAGHLLSRADLALASAESGGPFASRVDAATEFPDFVGTRAGQELWRLRLQEALSAQRARLIAYPVIDRRGTLLHYECLLRLQLDIDGAFEPASRWLPLATRGRLMPTLDLLALQLALTQIAADGRARAVNLALPSIADGGFAARLGSLLARDARAASLLWLEVDEGAALGQIELVRAFSAMVRPLGVRFGLEHAGHVLHRTARPYELGLDYVKLDAALLRGVSSDDSVRRFVASGVALLHALPAIVCAEGIDDGTDAQVLWDCNVDAVTGPWASKQRV